MNCPYDSRWLAENFPEIVAITPLGVGGQKWVFSGTHLRHGDVVLKLFHAGADDGRAEREIAAIQSISCPRIPKIHEAGVVERPNAKVLWIVEQRVPGIPLRQLLKVGLSDSQVLYITEHILEALAAAEAARIVHRDVKPENIQVDLAGKTAWLLDFGIARHLDLSSLTATDNIFGPCTAGYAPPEQFKNFKREIDGRADLFSLGVTMYEAIEGSNPYREGVRDAREMLHRTQTVVLPALSRQIEPSGSFADLIAAMTQTRPDHRPGSVIDALEWIQDIQNQRALHLL